MDVDGLGTNRRFRNCFGLFHAHCGPILPCAARYSVLGFGKRVLMEEVYVISGSRTFAITFDGDKPGFTLEKFGNYHTFLQMVETFEVKR